MKRKNKDKEPRKKRKKTDLKKEIERIENIGLEPEEKEIEQKIVKEEPIIKTRQDVVEIDSIRRKREVEKELEDIDKNVVNHIIYVGDDYSEVFTKFLSSAENIKKLTLVEYNIFNSRYEILRNLKSNNNIEQLELSCKLDDKLITSLNEMLKINKKIKKLTIRISGSLIYKTNINFLYGLKENKYIDNLCLEYKNDYSIKTWHVESIIKVLDTNPYIKSFSFSCDRMCFDDQLLLCESLNKNKNIERLDLLFKFWAEYKNLIKIIEINNTIKEIYFVFTRLNQLIFDKICNSLMKNKTINDFVFLGLCIDNIQHNLDRLNKLFLYNYELKNFNYINHISGKHEEDRLAIEKFNKRNQIITKTIFFKFNQHYDFSFNYLYK